MWLGLPQRDSAAAGDLDSCIFLLELKNVNRQHSIANPTGQRPVPPQKNSKIYVLWALPSCCCSGLSTMGPPSFGEQLWTLKSLPQLKVH